jgi:hypothetical protein
VDTAAHSVAECAGQVMGLLRSRGVIR